MVFAHQNSPKTKHSAMSIIDKYLWVRLNNIKCNYLEKEWSREIGADVENLLAVLLNAKVNT